MASRPDDSKPEAASALPPSGGGTSAAEVVSGALARSAARILAHEAGVQRGDDPEDVHQARVGTRRLRSDLQVAGVHQPDQLAAHVHELAGLAYAFDHTA